MLKDILESVSQKKDIVKALPSEAEVSKKADQSSVKMVTQIIPDDLITRVTEKPLDNVRNKRKEGKAKKDRTNLSQGDNMLDKFSKGFFQGLGVGLGFSLVSSIGILLITNIAHNHRLLHIIHSLVK